MYLPAMNLPPAARAVLHALACVPDGLSDRALLMVLPPLLPADAPPAVAARRLASPTKSATQGVAGRS